ncbi:FAD-linked oxidase [Marivirga lumbricoides]|uniref:FAD-linked oxidase n=1 Tax=Marivirga lumbricoides TaxID=1046115 RepID=A0A2T4DRX4_9BACT|nr:FAD-linked oxidase [Marivirga lumbricoides]
MHRKVRYFSNWNNFPRISSKEYFLYFKEEAPELISNLSPIIARGNGRCYGDASLSDNIISTLKHKNILSFDPEEGTIECESGILFKDLLEFLVPKGWFLPVTPGTKYITLGGAVASDVHGKNHHKEGSFSQHIIRFNILIENGEILEVTKHKYPDLFAATTGGMGLTGIILSVKFKLKKIETAFITQQQIQTKNLDHVIDLFSEYKDYTYTMAWIDCLKKGNNQGRSIMYAGKHSLLSEIPEKLKTKALSIPDKKKITIPFNLPSTILNKFSVQAFNQLYYSMHSNKHNQLIDLDSFFYPLDGLLEWNRMYGKRGFIQYQFVIPLSDNAMGLKKILNKISEKGLGSFLAVLKMFGPQNDIISFPMEGLTLALDFPIKKGLFDFLDELDKIVYDHGGRIYLSKDARLKTKSLINSHSNIETFLEITQKYNPRKKFISYLSNRILH